jgi:hypothetical protein
VSQNVDAIEFANDQLKHDREFLLTLGCHVFPRNRYFFSQMEKFDLITEELKQDIYQRLIQEQAKKMSRGPILDRLLDELLNYKNETIKNFVIHTFIRTSKEQFETVISIKDFTESQKKELSTLLLIITSLQTTDEIKRKFIQSLKNHYKPLFKDFIKRQILLQLFQNVDTVNNQNKYETITLLMDREKNKHLMNCIHMLSALSLFAPQKWNTLTSEDISLKNLATLLFGDLQKHKMIPEGDDNIVNAMSAFVTYRMPGAFLSYASQFINDSLMKNALLAFTTGIVRSTFLQDRNEANSHREFLTDEQKNLWQQPLDPVAVQKNERNVDFQIELFLYQKLAVDGHGGDCLSAVIPYLHNKSLDTSCFDELQKSVINLLSVERKALPYALRAIGRRLEDPKYVGLEFKNDIKDALAQLLEHKSKDPCHVVDTDHAEDLFLCGTEVTGSCQRVDGHPELNKCLMGYILDGKVRLLAVKNRQGNILSRAILKILIDEKNQPVLFLERVYGDQSFTWDLAAMADKKAQSMGIPLFEAGGNIVLKSVGNTAPFEYEDAVHTVTNGTYKIFAFSIGCA